LGNVVGRIQDTVSDVVLAAVVMNDEALHPYYD